jgi:hypothetical protein
MVALRLKHMTIKSGQREYQEAADHIYIMRSLGTLLRPFTALSYVGTDTSLSNSVQLNDYSLDSERVAVEVSSSNGIPGSPLAIYSQADRPPRLYAKGLSPFAASRPNWHDFALAPNWVPIGLFQLCATRSVASAIHLLRSKDTADHIS